MNESFQVILIGDTGAPVLNREDPVFNLLKKKLPADEHSALIFLGDNVYPNGIPTARSSGRELAEQRLIKQLESIKDYKGKMIFLSGNHDWNKGKQNGYHYVLRQQKIISNYLKDNDILLPAYGNSMPVEININNHFTIVAIDTQWWMQHTDKRLIGEKLKENAEDIFFEELHNILEKNKHNRVLIVGHLPIYSYALHGGRYKAKHHLFPLSIYSKKGKYIPLPIIGSLIPLYRKFLGAKEDMAHPRYSKFRKNIKSILRKYSNLIYAAGHEHNLQYIKKYKNHFIVSGAGSKLNYVSPGKYAEYAEAHKGFFILKVHSDKSVILEAWKIDEKHPEGKKAFEKGII
jgi:hypothetical protein